MKLVGKPNFTNPLIHVLNELVCEVQLISTLLSTKYHLNHTNIIVAFKSLLFLFVHTFLNEKKKV